MDQQNTLFAKMLTNLKLYSRFENYLNEYSARRNMLIVATVATFATLLSSIISALINLARVSVYDPIKDTYAPFGLAFFPLFFLVEAIIVLVIALVGVPMGIPKQMKGQIQTTLQQSPKE
jgi:poly-beta-hydroxyalkanoate depolymerase